ncbi:aminotransferase [Marinomonas piezotolerans]|uniref:Aminotransferase n=1 Tax=Marinomonas piezotolerans TaxID=2213058 RepID=A0A370U9D5_9GAMM|nr:aminotransferase class V-fold PLP-dependent enzyme [Marinomonas piezotolerans]RDL44400.1 aminotransferase [Marinomonas piezotolerans]
MSATIPHSPSHDSDHLMARIRDGIIGHDTQIQTPFGFRRLTYADYTASGRSLDFIEDAIRQHVLPLYANTHTEANATGQQTTAFREQARQQIRDAVNASSEDLVVFCGNGATGAINTLISQLGLRSLGPEQAANVCVFIGPYEHHSNELPWRELGVNVIRIPESNAGGVCLQTLEQQLQQRQDQRLIGSFSAASNVTGILCDQDAITSLLHRYKALSFWDFAAAAPYVTLDMNPTKGQEFAKDAMFFSTHKFIGGPSTPGILVVKKAIIQNSTPSHVGGGTVSFVTPEGHTFLDIGERREEGGTPGIIDAIRAGLVFQLKQAVGAQQIEAREHALVKMIDQRWQNHPQIERLGHQSAPRLSITAFRIRTPSGYLHHGFVTAALNDLFGIQVRGGCSCAGPYGHQLLGIDMAESERIQTALKQGEKLVKPGWVRFNFNYFIDEAEAEFILDAIDFIAEQGTALLPFYAYDNQNDLWRFQGHSQAPKALDNLLWQANSAPLPQVHSQERNQYLKQAQSIVSDCKNGRYAVQPQPFNTMFSDIKRFVLASDLQSIRDNTVSVK